MLVNMMAALIVKADVDGIGKVLNFITAELSGCPADVRPDILVAAEEIFVNIASYAYPPDAVGDAALSISIGGDAVIRFEDTGLPYNPLSQADPDLSVPLMEREIGGLGIYFVKNLMDKVEYEFTGGKNILTITKALIKPR
jgi:anti-sigma regulatory factor (Ser/Thr protein kinase)